MPVSPARRVAYDILQRVERGRDFAADLLRAPAVSSLSEPDQSLATELVLGVLRRRTELDSWITRLSGRELDYFDPEIVTILRLGVYQIRRLDRVPKSAAVNQAVEMAKTARKRSAAGLVNAVLRKCEPLRSKEGNAADDSEPLNLALPSWLAERWQQRFGVEVERALARWSLETPRTAARLVSAQDGVETIRRELAGEGVEAEPSAYSSRACVISRGTVTRTKLWRTGRLVIQDEASQLVGSLVKPEVHQRVLDLCAAPGMKTSQLAADLKSGLLIACDLSSRRLRSTQALVSPVIPEAVRWYRVQLDASLPLPFSTSFDRILLDAPCSGTGTLARNPEIKWRLKPEDIVRLSELQTRMLRGALPLVAPGGRLIYATCSLEREENDEVVERVLAEASGFRRLARAELVREWPAFAPLFDQDGYFRTRPGLHGTDGFFAAVLSRTS
ncbi:MAG TPA: 16S rRNA (cytosine(967)-C(5))-methyltransferase RsmB [Terriglobia bacterium]|nr:16S rRNA (cytosine(967)-C(5))-methyltransferase RsmB [Terriglobia bacterium]